MNLSEDLVSPKTYIVPYSSDSLNIDGLAAEKVWEAATFSDPFIDIEGKKTPQFQTRMKMLWDEKFLYVYAELMEPHIWGDITDRDQVIFYNNDFEVFIDPAGRTMPYGEIEINALGTVWDLLLDKPYRVSGKAVNFWNLTNLQSAIQIVGTLNDPNDLDSLWSVEMAIPMPALTELKEPPKSLPQEGEQWRINFSRVEWDFELRDGIYARKKDENGNYLPEHNWVWSNQKVINMHEPEKWGIVQFTKNSSGDQVKFREDDDFVFKQVLYALFRKTIQNQIEPDPENRSKSLVEVTYLDHKDISVQYTKTQMGFEYALVSPLSGSKYVINEIGSLIKTE